MISVIIPTYNRTKLLMERAIPSILAQTDPDWECLVVGDGTEQATVEAMDDLCRNDKRFRFWNLAHDIYPEGHIDLAGQRGPAGWGLYGLTALNYGLDFARGEWVSVLNDDDEKTPDNHEVLLERARKSEADFAYGMSDTWKGDPPRPTGQLYGSYPMGESRVTQGSYIYRRSLEFRYRRDCLERGQNGDADMWERMREAGVKHSFIDRVVHHYYRNFP